MNIGRYWHHSVTLLGYPIAQTTKTDLLRRAYVSCISNIFAGKKTATRSQSSTQSSQLQAPQVEQAAQEGAESVGQTPLKLVVKEAVKRW